MRTLCSPSIKYERAGRKIINKTKIIHTFTESQRRLRFSHSKPTSSIIHSPYMNITLISTKLF